MKVEDKKSERGGACIFSFFLVSYLIPSLYHPYINCRNSRVAQVGGGPGPRVQRPQPHRLAGHPARHQGPRGAVRGPARAGGPQEGGHLHLHHAGTVSSMTSSDTFPFLSICAFVCVFGENSGPQEGGHLHLHHAGTRRGASRLSTSYRFFLCIKKCIVCNVEPGRRLAFPSPPVNSSPHVLLKLSYVHRTASRARARA
jgi:hypothetical protein